MPSKVLKQGKVVILLNGRFAGRKAVIVQSFEEGIEKSRPYGCCLVAGIERYPKRVTMAMSRKKVAKRSKLKTFVKIVNFNHVMPTRYGLDIDLKNTVSQDKVYGEKKNRRAVKAQVKKVFEERYKTGKNKWFFTKLRF